MSTAPKRTKGPTRDELFELGAQAAARSRKAQGLPPTVEDEATLRRVVRLLRSADEKLGRRHELE